MNVKTVKRFSKRTLSTLLSILMVISLFTVCMVGTTVSVGAIGAWVSVAVPSDFNGWDSTTYMQTLSSDDGYWYGSFKVPSGTSHGTKNYKFLVRDNEAVELWIGDGNGGGDFTTNYQGESYVNFKIQNGGNIQDCWYSDTPLKLFSVKDCQVGVNVGTSDWSLYNMTYDSSKDCWYYSLEVPDNLRDGNEHNIQYYIRGKKGTASDYSYFPGSGQNPIIKYDGRTEYIIFTFYPNNGSKPYSMGAVLNRKPQTDAERYSYVNAVLYNYRSNHQVSKNDNTYPNTIPFQGTYGTLTRKEFSEYNTQVSQWYKNSYSANGIYIDDDYTSKATESSVNATPLYQGNFRRGNATSDHGNSGTLDSGVTDIYKFVSVANGANRYSYSQNNSQFDSTTAVALNLVDANMHNNTITQNGVELPQFSDKFMNSAYGKSGGQSVQWKHEIKFPFDTLKTANGNTRYIYDASLLNNNRYYVEGNDTLQSGPSVEGYSSGHYGYFPFNPINLGDAGKLSKNQITNSFGTRFDVEFVMPKGGMMNGEELTFDFQGDDDVWVYVDGILVLDMGGSHNNAQGSINFATKQSTITSGYYNGDYASVGSANLSSAGDNVPVTNADKTTPFSDALVLTENKKHTLTVFYLERGEFDSNFEMSFMLPMASNLLNLSHEVDSSNVNDGLRRETMEVANKDVFDVQMKTQIMPAGQANSVKLPLTSDFTRKNPKGDTTTTLQKVGSASGTVSNTASDAHHTFVKAYYEWSDNSKLLDYWGRNTTTDAASHSGVGIPGDQGHIYLLYGQKATFYSQFPSASTGHEIQKYGVSVKPQYSILNFTMDNTLKSFGTAPDTGLMPVASASGRGRVAAYYNTSVWGTGAGENYNDSAVTFDGTSGKVVFIKTDHVEINYNHVIRTGEFSLEKKLVEGAANEGQYTFMIEYKNLFGKVDDTWHKAEGLTGFGYNSNNNAIEEKRIVGEDGKIGMKPDEKITFKGIPVATLIRITEVSNPNYSVTQVIAENSTDDTTQSSTTTKNTIGGTDGRTDNSRSNGGGTVYTSNINEESSGGPVGTSFNVSGERDNSQTEGDDPFVPFRTGMQEKASWDYEVYNGSSSNAYAVPTFYRFIDRQVVNGKPTVMQEGFTYFRKDIPNSSFEELIDTTSATPTIKGETARELIARNAPDIDNVHKAYSLNTTDGPVVPNDDNPNYQVDRYELRDVTSSIKALLDDENAVIETNSVGYNDVLKKIINDAKGSTTLTGTADEKYEAILDNLKDYVYVKDNNCYVIVATYAAATKNYSVTMYYYKDDGTVANEVVHRPFNGFVPIRDVDSDTEGVTAQRNITKGGANLRFAYWAQRVEYYNDSNTTKTIKWVPVSTNYAYCYRVVSDITVSAVYTDGTTAYIAGDDSATSRPTFVPLDDGADYTLTEDDQPFYCLPNDESGEAGSKMTGFDSMATEVMKNHYSKGQTDYMRIDVVFGSVGSLDNDDKITHVGYMLFRGSKKAAGSVEETYANTSGLTEERLKKIVSDNLEKVDNKRNQVSKTITVDVNGTNMSCLFGKATVVDKSYGQSESNYEQLDKGYINLTNKNRVDVVFNIKNTAQTRISKFTCYTYMVRNGKIYISNTPATFQLDDPNKIKQGNGGGSVTTVTKYPVECKNYAKNKTDSNYTETSDFGYVKESYSKVANGTMLSLKVKPQVATDSSDHVSYKGKLDQIVITAKDGGAPLATYSDSAINSILTNNGGILSYSFNDTGVGSNGIVVKAYFIKEPQGLSVTKADYTTTTRSDDDTSGNNTYTMAMVDVNGDVINSVVPIDYPATGEAEVLITVTPSEGYEITNKQGFGVANGVATKKVTINSTTTPEQLTEAIGTWPTIEEKTYTLTVKATAGGEVSVTCNGQNSVDVSAGGSTTMPAVGYWKIKNVHPTYTLTPAASADYSFNGWTDAISGNSDPVDYTFNVTQNVTITANFKSNAHKIYFAFINQDWNNSYPRDVAHKDIYSRYAGYSNINNNNFAPSKYYWNTVYAYRYNHDNDKEADWHGRTMTYEGIYKSSSGDYACIYSLEVSNNNYSKIIFNGDTSGGESNPVTLDNSNNYGVDKVFYSNGGAVEKFDCSYNNFSNWTYITR